MSFIRRYFGTLLLFSCLIGMVVPSAGESTSLIVLLALAFIIFSSFFQINFSADALRSDFKISLWFWFLRFVLMPVIAYLTCQWISDFYAPVLLLTLLLPAAVSSPSFSVMYGGKPDLSLKILLISSFLSVMIIPFMMTLLMGATLQVDAGKMLLTLIYTIVLPFILHLPLRKIPIIKTTFIRYNALFTLAGLALIFVVVTARNKPVILGNPGLIAIFAIEALALYAVLYLAGYYLLPNQSPILRRTFSISSGANNIGLGVTLTALFFPGNMNVFFIVAQLAWVVALIPLRRILMEKRKKG